MTLRDWIATQPDRDEARLLAVANTRPQTGTETITETVTIPEDVRGMGVLYVRALRRLFPEIEAPECDRTLTPEAVAWALAQRQDAGLLTPANQGDMEICRTFLPILCANSGDGTAWGFSFGAESYQRPVERVLTADSPARCALGREATMADIREAMQ